MKELLIKWQFKNKNWIEYSFCKDETEFYALMRKRYAVDRERIIIISIKEIDDKYFNKK